MQIKLFTIPAGDSGKALQELNSFLKSNKVLEVENHLVSNENGAFWCFCVRYIERSFGESPAGESKRKIDYRKVLDEETFQKFSTLREIRKRVAAEEGISAFIIFTDAELAELAKLDEITEKAMLGIKGVGEKKVGRFAKYFVTQATEANEKGGKLDGADN